MRVAYLTSQYPKASHTFIRREIDGLEALGHEVLRLSIRRTPPADLADPADVEEARRTDVFFAAAPAAWAAALLRGLARRPGPILRELARALGAAFGPGPPLSRRVAYWLQAVYFLERLERRGIQHVHVHFGRNAANVARIVRRLGGPPFSMTVHGPHEFDDPEGHELAGKMADAAFTAAISHYTTAQLRRWADPADWGKLAIMGCTVDEAFFDAARPVDPASRTLVCVGRLCAQKAQLVLVEAFAALADEAPEARLVLAGDGEMRPEVEAAIRSHGLEARVEITGWVSEAEVREHVLAARALVLPSFAEGLPVVLMEAFALGRPVVSTFVAGIPELVHAGESGWLVPSGDVAALRGALAEALACPADRLDAMARAGAKAVREGHLQATEAARLGALLGGL